MGRKRKTQRRVLIVPNCPILLSRPPKEKDMNHKQARIIGTALGTALLCVLLGFSVGAVLAASGIPPGWRRVFDAPTPEERATVMRHLNYDSYLTDISLEVREVDDFLLTPALLVQEAVSEGGILTYPEE